MIDVVRLFLYSRALNSGFSVFVLPSKTMWLEMFLTCLFPLAVNSDIDDVHNDLLHLDIWSVVITNKQHIPHPYARLDFHSGLLALPVDNSGLYLRRRGQTLTC